MRARGAQMTDIVVLVVAADDGVDAADHRGDQPRQGGARSRSSSRSTRSTSRAPTRTSIRNKLSEHGLVPEEWGGETIFVQRLGARPRRASTSCSRCSPAGRAARAQGQPEQAGQGARRRGAPRPRPRPDRDHPGRGRHAARSATWSSPASTSGKIRAMLDDKGQSRHRGRPVDAGRGAGPRRRARRRRDRSTSSTTRRRPRRWSSTGTTRAARRSWRARGRVSLENILDKIKAGEVKEVKIVLKADVQGSVEAVANALTKLSTETVGVNVISTGVGGITESDVNLAKASAAHRHRLQRPPRRQGAAAGRAGGRRHQALPDHLRRHRRREEGDGRHAGADHAREARWARRRCARSSPSRRRGRSPAASSPRARSRARRSCAWCATRSSSTRARSARCGGSRTTPREVAQGYECGLSIEGYGDLKEGDIIEAFEIEIRRAPTLENPARRRQALASEIRAVTVGDRARDAVPGREPLAQGEADGAAQGQGSGAQQVQRVDRRGVARTISWQRAVLGLSLVGSDRRFAESALDEVLRFIRGHAEVVERGEGAAVLRRRAGGPRLQALGGVSGCRSGWSGSPGEVRAIAGRGAGARRDQGSARARRRADHGDARARLGRSAPRVGAVHRARPRRGGARAWCARGSNTRAATSARPSRGGCG